MMHVDAGAVKYNLAQIQKLVGKDVLVMPVIKANAYGMGIEFFAELLKDSKFLGVADVNEAIQIANIVEPHKIFILYQPPMDAVGEIAKYGFTTAVCEMDFLKSLNKAATKPINVHMSIDTGLGVLGIQPGEVAGFYNAAQAFKNINIGGAFSQFAAHESLDPADINFSNSQVTQFHNATKGLDLKYKHISCSAAIITRPDDNMDLVRVGCLLYGIYPQDFFKKHINVKPVCKISCQIIAIKDLELGDMVGYRHAGSFKAKHKTTNATVNIGYAQGLTRSICDKGYFIVNGQRAPIISISMNICNIDITNIKGNVKLGDEVLIVDNKMTSIEDLADWCGVGFDELLTHLTFTS